MLRADWFVYKLVKPNLHTTTSQMIKWEKNIQIVSLHPPNHLVLLMPNLTFSAMYCTLHVLHIVFLNDVLLLIVICVCECGCKDPMCDQNSFPSDIRRLGCCQWVILTAMTLELHVQSDVFETAWQMTNMFIPHQYH